MSSLFLYCSSGNNRTESFVSDVFYTSTAPFHGPKLLNSGPLLSVPDSCDLCQSSEDDDRPLSCLAKYKRPLESPKKKVSFSLDKENDGLYMRKLSGYSHKVEQEMELEKMKCLLELQDRLLLAKRKSDTLRKIEYDSQYRAQHLLSGIR